MNDVLRQNLHNKATEQIGMLRYDEIFFFVPALILGGAEDMKYVKKGDAATHQALLFNFHTK